MPRRTSVAIVLAAPLVALFGCTKELPDPDSALSAGLHSVEHVGVSSAILLKKILPTRVADFTLVDQNGKSHRLYDLTKKDAVVLVWHGVGCPIVQQTTPTLRELRDKFERRNVAFLMINSNPQDTPKMIKAEADSFQLGLPILKDADQKVAASLGVERTAEVFIVDPKRDWKIHYHGPLDDRLTYGRAKAKADNNWASDVLTALLAGEDIAPLSRPADGCIINYVAGSG